MFAVIVQSCQAKVALTDTSYQHQKKLVGIRDSFQKWTFRRQQQQQQPQHGSSTNQPTLSWPESLTWITTDTVSQKSATSKSALSLPPRDVDDFLYRQQVAFLQYTSGSTSDPKGVMITHGNLAHNLHCITNELQATEDTVVVSWLPQYHDMGLIGSVLGCLYCGGTGYYMSPLTFLQRPMIWMECVSIYRGTHLQAPNFAYKLTARKFQETQYPKDSHSKEDRVLDLSSVRHAINAAEPVDIDSLSAFYETFQPYGLRRIIYPTYGLAEHTVFVCSGGQQVIRVRKEELEVHRRVVIIDANVMNNTATAAAANGGDTDGSSIMVGCGYPTKQGIDVRIVTYKDDESTDNNNNGGSSTGSTKAATALQEDVVGEIWIRSPSKAAGYYGKPQETLEDFYAQLDPPDQSIAQSSDDGNGYLRTGDLGFLHNNELFICGRLKDLIIVGGRNYYPQDIEATAESSTDQLRLGCSAAFTIDPTARGGEEVALVVELKEVPSTKDISAICDPLASQLRSLINQDHSISLSSITFLKPRTVPKTSSGKIARSWCRKAYIAGTLNIVYQKSFKVETTSLEIEQDQTVTEHQPPATTNQQQGVSNNAIAIRAMNKETILKMLVTDVSRAANMNINSVDTKAALVHMLDSLSITQFKGMLENNYFVKLSDEYLFRETTTITKLVEVVKLGYAPDDVADGSNTAATAAATSTTPVPGQAKGLAGALGCPPGVVCVIM
jgi:acyl-CoA synthetase (AMP-forming)/AMP-acid ligase II